MDERNELNERKREHAQHMATTLGALFVKIMRWQVATRGLTERAAYGEAKRELDAMLGNVNEDVTAKLQGAYMDMRRDD